MCDLLEFCRIYSISSHPKKKRQLIRFILALVADGSIQEPSNAVNREDNGLVKDDEVEEDGSAMNDDDVEDVDGDEIGGIDDIEEDDFESMIDEKNIPRVVVMTKPRRDDHRNNTAK